jgi:hypothetical protein
MPALAHAAADDPKPTAWTERVQPIEAVERLAMPPVDAQALKAEDDRHYAESGEKDLRYAASLKADLSPETAGTWERLDSGELLWRLRVYSKEARSLNFGFDQYAMTPNGRLFIYSADGKHVYRPFTAADNEEHGQLWTPPVFGEETVLEVTIPEAERSALKLHLQVVNHDYRGFGQPNMEKSGACNIDIVCPISTPFDNQERANGVISTGGSRFCSGSLLNNTANDAKPYFMTANHCGINAGNAASLVVFWNYYNSTCRPQGGGNSPPGNGNLTQFNTGSFFRAAFANSDFTLVELDDALAPAHNLYLAGWDRTPNPTQFLDVVGIHHPNTEEMRISFTTGLTVADRWGAEPIGSHVKVFWGTGLGVTEPGSSGSPIYTQQKRFVGQLHGGASVCGGADLTDLYGRFSESWVGGATNATRASNWLDPIATGQIQIDGRNACTFPAAPGTVTATATAPNTIQVTWTPVAGASGYNVLRAVGACPQTNYVPIATNFAGTTYNDTTVSGGITYSYVVQSIVSACPSLNSACTQATATGGCTIPPTFAGLTSATSGGTTACAINLAWSAATPGCTGTTVKYNVYRSTTPGTAPSLATLRQSCLTTTTFTDSMVNSGTRYYYVVRAEDSQTIGNGACNNGIQDANAVERNAVPGGPATTVVDDMENGAANWNTTGGNGTNVWTIVTTQSHSPTRSFFTQDIPIVSLQPLRKVAAVNFPSGGVLSWWHRVDTESTFDGYVVEYSLNGGTTWSDILAGQGSVPANPNRFTLNGYNSTLSTGFNNPLPGRRAWSGAILAFQEVRVDMADFAGQSVTLRFLSGTDSSVSVTGVWIDDVSITTATACNTVPNVAVAPEALAVDAAGNGIFEPNETVVMAPTWRNTGATAVAFIGTLDAHIGPPGATYTTPDAAASYASIAVGGTGSCGANCYSVGNATTARPLTHWDSNVVERLTLPTTTTIHTWKLHIGQSFSDVPTTSGFYRFVETILHKNVTGGCGTGIYCPSASTTREQMAVFVLVAREPAGFNPPACVAGSEVFSDVPASSPFCRWVEELARRGVVSGCGNGQYCAGNPAVRDQMSVFVLRTLAGTINPPACVAGSEMFADLPASSPFCRWVEELARRGVVTGCGGGNYCPGANVTREQMSVFLSVTFGLVLYGL